MRLPLRFTVLLGTTFLLSAAPDLPIESFDRTRGVTGSGEILAFVGQAVSVTEAPPDPDDTYVDPVTGEEQIVIRMASEWQARFLVRDVVSGDFEGTRIDFTAFDHYGRPRFADQDGSVLLFVHDFDYGFFHDKYNSVPVYRGVDGGWHSCGDPFDGRKKITPTDSDPPILRRVEFSEPVSFDLETLYQNPDALDEDSRAEYDDSSATDQAEWRAEMDETNQELDAYYAAPVFERDGDLARCVRGVPVEDIVEHMTRTRFRSRKVLAHCEVQFEHMPSEDEAGKYQPALASARRDREQACFEQLYSSGWPYTD